MTEPLRGIGTRLSIGNRLTCFIVKAHEVHYSLADESVDLFVEALIVDLSPGITQLSTRIGENNHTHGASNARGDQSYDSDPEFSAHSVAVICELDSSMTI